MQSLLACCNNAGWVDLQGTLNLESAHPGSLHEQSPAARAAGTGASSAAVPLRCTCSCRRSPSRSHGCRLLNTRAVHARAAVAGKLPCACQARPRAWPLHPRHLHAASLPRCLSSAVWIRLSAPAPAPILQRLPGGQPNLRASTASVQLRTAAASVQLRAASVCYLLRGFVLLEGSEAEVLAAAVLAS